MKRIVLVMALVLALVVVVVIMASAQDGTGQAASTVGKTELAVAHLAPFAKDPDTAVTVEVDGNPVLNGFEFSDSTGYLELDAGVDHLIEVFPAGSTTAAISATVNLTEGMAFTAIAIGGANSWDLGLKLLEDDNSAPSGGKAKVRIGHLAPFAAQATDTLADVRLQDGTVLLDDVPYGTIADWLELDADTYDLKITTADGRIKTYAIRLRRRSRTRRNTLPRCHNKKATISTSPAKRTTCAATPGCTR